MAREARTIPRLATRLRRVAARRPLAGGEPAYAASFKYVSAISLATRSAS